MSSIAPDLRFFNKVSNPVLEGEKAQDAEHYIAEGGIFDDLSCQPHGG
jgi:hypothetical protein